MAKAKSPTVYLVGPSGDFSSAEKIAATDGRLTSTPNLVYYQSPDGAYYAVVHGSSAETTLLKSFAAGSADESVPPMEAAPAPIVKANAAVADAAAKTQKAAADASAVKAQDSTGITTATSTAPAGSDAAAAGVNADGTSTTANPYATAGTGGGTLDTLSAAKQQLEGVDVISGHEHQRHVANYGPGDGQREIDNKADLTSKASDLLNAVYSLDDKHLEALQTKLQAAGYTTKPGDDLTATLGAYVSLIADVSSADANAKPGSQNFHVAVDDYLNRKAGAEGIGPDGKPNGKGGKTKSETSSSVDLTDPTTAQGLIVKALSDHLGRKPTDQQVKDFTSALQSAESANPTTKTVSGSQDTLLGQTTGNTSSVSSGGVGDLGQFADNYVQNNYGAESSTDQIGTVYGLAMKALGLSGG